MALTDNLQAYYKLDEASGNNRDDSVNSNDLNEYAGAVAQSTGVLNSSADFNGSTSRLRASTDMKYDTFSVSYWAKNTGLFNQNTGSTWGLATGWALYNNSGTLPNLVFQGLESGTKWNLVGTHPISAGEWHHIVATRVNSGYARVYVNNVEELSVADSGTTDFGTSMGSTQKLTVGSLGGAFGSPDVEIDEYGYWDRELTVAEVAHLWSAGQGAFYDNNNANDFDDEVPVCWNYTAQYKGSTKMFKLSGPGDFPKRINIPGNIDTSTGKMIDDGQEIDPSNYEVE